MKKIISIFVKYPFYANIIIAILILAGGFSLWSMKKSFFPYREARFITVSIFYPGASPKEMEEGCTMRIEEAIRGIVGIKEFTSTSSENMSTVRIETTGEYDIDETLMEVKNAVDGISSFPVDAEKPIVSKQREVTPAVRLGLSGDVDLMTLKKYAYDIQDDFYASGIISQISLSGFPDPEISVEVEEEDLLRYNVTFDEIARAISMNNRDISAGMIKSMEQEILIRSRARSVEPDKIGDIIIRANPDGSNLLIRDIANIKIKFADVASKSLMNGKQAVYFVINKLNEEDLDEISEYINAYADEFNTKNEDVKLEITFDYLSILGSRLDLLLENGGIGLLLVIFSLALFLNFRLSLWVAWGIPASFLAMFIIANIYGITINMISLFGMILVVGILVDDGIVIGENIYSHFERGKSPPRSAIDGTMEVLPAVLTSITTTIVAFSPLLFIEGRMEFMFEMAFIVIFSLGFSLFEAFFVLPAHVGNHHILRRQENMKGIGKKIRKYLDRVVFYLRDNIYGKVLDTIIRWKYIFLVTPIALILITVGLFNGGLLQFTFFPSVAFDFFSVNIAFTPGSGERQTMEYLKKFDSAIWTVNDELKQEYQDTNDYITYSFINLGNSFNGKERGSHAGNIFVLLRDMEGAPVSSFEIVQKVRQEIGEIPEADKFTVGGQNRWGSPVSISLLGKNLDELKSAKEFMKTELAKFQALENINDNDAAGKQEVRLKLKPKAYFLGLDHAGISKQVRQGFYGGQAQRLQHGKDELRVWVRYPKEDRLNLGQLEKMKIKTPQGEYPLSELATYEIKRGPVNIQRYNSSREVRIEADMVDPYAPVPPVLEEIRQTIIPELQVNFPGIDIIYQGQQKDSAESGEQLIKYFGIAFAIIILLLMLHFKSTTQAIIILLMIPLALLGAMWGHGLHGRPVSMLSAWGMVALSGVIVNDAVVFLTKYNSLLLQGYSVVQAVYNAGLARFRPILLTTITTTIGLYPIILEKSVQAQFLIPMAISLAYGVLIGTGFILLFFPVLILVLNDMKYYANWLWNGFRPEREELEVAVINSKKKID